MHKILIVDDDPVTRTILARTVESEKCVCVQLSQGKLALDFLRDNPDISLVITDMSMPELDGRALIKVLRQDNDLKAIPVIIVSGVVSLHEIYDLLGNGADYFVPKPVDTEVLQTYVNRLLHKRQQPTCQAQSL
ncbi:MAG: response regulator [Candidatus Dadabacteria bacterium]|nr:MAG: response regulator [Candidatus Dadabacteria bacterium]